MGPVVCATYPGNTENPRKRSRPCRRRLEEGSRRAQAPSLESRGSGDRISARKDPTTSHCRKKLPVQLFRQLPQAGPGESPRAGNTCGWNQQASSDLPLTNTYIFFLKINSMNS